MAHRLAKHLDASPEKLKEFEETRAKALVPVHEGEAQERGEAPLEFPAGDAFSMTPRG